MTMLDSRIPLTYAERKMIIDGLYDLAFKAGMAAHQKQLHDELQEIADNYRAETYRNYRPEYEDPTTTIRRRLEDKDRNGQD